MMPGRGAERLTQHAEESGHEQGVHAAVSPPAAGDAVAARHGEAVETVVERRAAAEPRTHSRIASPADAIRRDEVARVRTFAAVILALSLVGIGMLLLVGGDPVAKLVFGGSVAIVAASYVVLLYVTRDAERIDHGRIGVITQFGTAATIGLMYYVGPLSAAVVVNVIGLYVYAQGTSAKWSLIAFVNLLVAYLVVALPTALGALEERSLVRMDDLLMGEKLTIIAVVVFFHLMAYLLGRANQAKTSEHLAQLEHAIKRSIRHQAMLLEAREELDRHAQVGGEGRYTGQVLGSFQLGDVLGRGGMGDVYEARHVGTEQEAAVKLLHPHLLFSRDHVERFSREVEIAAALASPAIVRVLEVSGPEAPTSYLAMERLHGQDLADVLRERGRLTLRETMELVQQVGAGLSAAHEAGIIHRDLKPHNLFAVGLTEGRAQWKILDFGVSKLLGADSTLTHGQVVGTPSYMAPEQARSQDVDQRADVYSLAAVAYRCLTGQPLFVERDVPTALYNAVHVVPVRPSALTELPADVERALALGLAKDRAHRIGSAGQLVEAFVRAARDELPESWRRRADGLVARAPWSEV